MAPPAREVRGLERITYFNDSPDTLKQLAIKLFMNAHRPGAARKRDVTPNYLTSGVQIDSFAVNGAAGHVASGRHHDHCPRDAAEPVAAA